MNLKDVKEITIPQGAVKKIEDSNGKIIWGSQDAFPYRRLEYLYFNGTDNYVSLGGKASYNRQDRITATILSTTQDAGLCGGYSSTGLWQRYYLPRWNAAGQMRVAIGNGWSSYMTCNMNTKYKFILKTGNSATANCTFELRNGDTDALVTTTTWAATQNTSGTTANNPVLYLGALQNYQQQIAVNFVEANIYEFRRSSLDGASYVYHYIPCQRKSDGKYGMFNCTNQTFNVLEGTADASKMGPVLDEYWDLTDPFN